MLDTVTTLKELLEPGLLGNYTWFEAVEVIAFSSTQATDEVLVRNIFSIYVAEPGEQPSDSKQIFLDRKSKKLKGLDGWSFRVTKRPVGIAELLACIECYGRTGVWIPPDQKALQVGRLVAAPPMFCPPDSRDEVPLNAVLKNNFWSGSYVIELKDEGKSTLTDLVREDALFEELSEWLTTMLPLNIARVPDRIGDILFQIPSNALIAEFRRRPGMPVDLRMAWNPEIAARPVVGEYRVEQDGLITSIARFEFPVGAASLDIPSTSGDLRFSVWDTQKQLLLAATAPLYAPGGKWRVESSTSTGLEQPRRFEVKGPANTIESHEIGLTEPAGGWCSHWQPRRQEEVDWRARRELKARMKQLVASRRFVQYGNGNASPQEEHRRALEDIRQLIRTANQGAIYLWDPYLSANDVLNTLAFCSDAGTELWALTSAKPSKKGASDDENDDGTEDIEVTARGAWIKAQQDTLNTAFIGPSNMKLEFRMSWGIQGSFHDRFLMFPGLGRDRTRVWSLGASINHIGAQHCIVQEVAYPEPVLQAFKAFWDQSDQPEHLIWKYS
ncbi:hypothetical protein DDY07_23345 [Methylomonas sp. ZR1]|nr:hypothetical protein [Methylomonas sp. ZR1]